MKQLNLPSSIESLIAMDRMYMYMNYGEDYRWYEVQARLNNFLDEENDGSMESVTIVFQAIVNRSESSFDTLVVMFTHDESGVDISVNHSFWIEDYSLNDEKIVLTFDEAFDKIHQVNLPKPHSKNVTLRNPIGPKAVNAQYIFGNLRSQLWVDSVTGEVATSNPAFPPQVAKPLGEWP